MKNVLFSLIIIFSFINTANANDLAKGKQLYVVCQSCHGDKGQGNEQLQAPALAGQYQWYLAAQLSNFKSGKRGTQSGDILGAQMIAMANTLVDQDAINNVSAYLASLATVPVKFEQTGDARNGDNKYNAQCGACHGPDATGNKSLQAPNLSILSATYLTKQMANFKANLRGYHQEDKLGRQMKMMASMVQKDQDVADIVNFINSKSK